MGRTPYNKLVQEFTSLEAKSKQATVQEVLPFFCEIPYYCTFGSKKIEAKQIFHRLVQISPTSEILPHLLSSYKNCLNEEIKTDIMLSIWRFFGKTKKKAGLPFPSEEQIRTFIEQLAQDVTIFSKDFEFGVISIISSLLERDGERNLRYCVLRSGGAKIIFDAIDHTTKHTFWQGEESCANLVVVTIMDISLDPWLGQVITNDQMSCLFLHLKRLSNFETGSPEWVNCICLTIAAVNFGRTHQSLDSFLPQSIEQISKHVFLDALKKETVAVLKFSDAILTLESFVINEAYKEKILNMNEDIVHLLVGIVSDPETTLDDCRRCLRILNHLSITVLGQEFLKPYLNYFSSLTASGDYEIAITSASIISTCQLSKPNVNKGDQKHLSIPRKATNVMISYSWAEKEKVLELLPLLRAQFKTSDFWIDIENMQGNIVDKMAEAIDAADVIFCFVSQSYSDSANCKKELIYSDKQGKKIIFIKVQSLRPIGWLGMIMGQELYVSCEPWEPSSIVSQIAEQMKRNFFLSEQPTQTLSSVSTDRITIRRLEQKRGGLLLKLPSSLSELLMEGGKLLGIQAAAVRFPPPAESLITNINLIMKDDIVILTTADEEKLFA
eukprot:Pompholyxophrys_punicea_v1_NODE_451_length_1937_cov_3.225292.p1 type:complete len:611 gc:universal NODE_451_length_1937_cov_3.225292:79-1911(+)